MLELVDEADSKSVGLITRAGSTPATGTSVRRSKHRSVSALRRKLHYVSSFFLLNCDPLCWARSLVFVFRCISIRNLSQNTESDQLMVLFFLYKSNLLRLALIWGLRSAASLSRIEAVLRLRLRQCSVTHGTRLIDGGTHFVRKLYVSAVLDIVAGVD